MKLEKLYLFANSAMEVPTKIKWLKHCNSSAKMSENVKFLPKGFSDDTWKLWLLKVIWWAHVSRKIHSKKFVLPRGFRHRQPHLANVPRRLLMRATLAGDSATKVAGAGSLSWRVAP